MRLIIKSLLVFVPVIVLTSSYRSFKYDAENSSSENVNIHNWRVYFNDSMVCSTIPQDYLKKTRQHPIQRDFKFSVYEKEIREIDSIQIKYYSDVLCGVGSPLILILNSKGKTIKRIESRDKFNIYDLNIAFPNDTLFNIKYTESECNRVTKGIVWDEEHLVNIMSLEIKQ